jgi:hypothetical protein
MTDTYPAIPLHCILGLSAQFPITGADCFMDYEAQGQTIPYVIIDLAPPPTSGLPLFNLYVSRFRVVLGATRPDCFGTSRTKFSCRCMNPNLPTRMRGGSRWTWPRSSGGTRCRQNDIGLLFVYTRPSSFHLAVQLVKSSSLEVL